MHPVPDGWYQGKRIAVDGHNVAFRYLTSFRSPNGDVLRAKGSDRVIAHLVGYTNLVRHFRERGAEPIIVWDGEVHPRKRATVTGRIEGRMESVAQERVTRDELEAATLLGDTAFGALERDRLASEQSLLVAGDATTQMRRDELGELLQQTDLDLARRRRADLQELLFKHMRATTYLDDKMIEDCSRLLEALGVAVVHADHDGERYATALCHAGFADAVATEDFDALVAGAPFVIRKAGSPDPFLHRIEDLQGHGLSLPQLRQIAILCGTDWHPGVKGFGAKTAMKAMANHSDLRHLFSAGAGRHHKLVADSGMTLQEFDDLDAFIADLPKPTVAPRAPRPSPEMAVAVAEEMGLGPDRVLACFC